MKLVNKRRNGTKVSAEDRKRMLRMYNELEGGKQYRCKKIARKIGNVHWQTVDRIVKEEQAALVAKAGPETGSDDGFQGAQWSGDNQLTSYTSIDRAHAEWHGRRGITGTPEQERVAREQAARGKAA
jgi:hypothetical protein